VLPGLTAAGVFWLKLRTPIPSVLLEKQVQEAPHWRAILQRNGGRTAGLMFTPTALAAYFRPDAVTRHPDWPFFDFRFPQQPILWVPPLPAGGAYVEPVASVTATMPLPWIVTLAVAIWLGVEAWRLADTDRRRGASSSLSPVLTSEQWILAAGLLTSAAAMVALTVTLPVFLPLAIAVVAGGLLGLLAGYAGGQADGLVMRLMDAVLSFPPLVLALALGAVLGAGLTGVVIALGVVYTPTFARLMRGQVLTITAREYVEAARALGAPGWRIAWHHVLPNAIAPIVIQASLSVAFAILAEASLSFLGLGIQPPGASWGSMINAGRGYLQQAPWIVFGPGAALFITVVGLNFVGDAVRDALDPRLRA